MGVFASGTLFYVLAASGIDHDLVAGVTVWMILLISLKDHRYLIIGWFLVAPYFPFGTQGQTNLALNVSHNLLVPFVALVTLGSSLVRGNKIAWGREDLLFLTFLLYAVFSSYYSSGGRYEDLKAIYSIYLLPFLLYAAAKNLKIDLHFVTVLVYACLFHLAVLSLTGYFEFRTGVSLYTGLLRWTDVGMGRIAGPFGTPIILGVCVSFLSLFLYLGYMLGLVSRPVFGVAVLLSGGVYVLTFTRSVWLGIITSVVYLIYKGSARPSIRAAMFLAFVGVLLALGVYLVSDPALAERVLNPETGSARMGVAYGSLKLIAQYPIFGAGFGSFDELIPKYLPNYLLGTRIPLTTSHVTLLTLVADLGVAGTSLLLAFIFAALSQSTNQPRSLSSNSRLLITVNYGFMLAFAVNAFLIDMRFFSLAYCWLFLSLGMIRNVRKGDSSGLE